MLWPGRRLTVLLQDEHRCNDEHPGRGSWQRSVEGIRTALAEGFAVWGAATLVTSAVEEERTLRTFLDGPGIPRDDQALRPMAKQGFAESGLELSARPSCQRSP